MYAYYMTMRPPMPGAQPHGMDHFEEYEQRTEMPDGTMAWATIYYKRELTEDEIRTYELRKASENF